MRYDLKHSKSATPKHFEGQFPLDVEYAAKAATVIKDDGVVQDYRGVSFAGYASTFAFVDRDNESMAQGCFREGIKTFMTNPVMLVDHRNQVANIAGFYLDCREDAKGLWVRGQVSDAPDMHSVRFKLMEGSLRSLSVAGLMRFADDGTTITQVMLYEISLVAIPSNAESLISVIKTRDLTPDETKKFSLETAVARPAEPAGIKGIQSEKSQRRTTLPWAGLAIIH